MTIIVPIEGVNRASYFDRPANLEPLTKVRSGDFNNLAAAVQAGFQNIPAISQNWSGVQDFSYGTVRAGLPVAAEDVATRGFVEGLIVGAGKIPAAPSTGTFALTTIEGVTAWRLQSAQTSVPANSMLVKPTIKDYIEQFQVLNPGATVTADPAGGTLMKVTTNQATTTINLPAFVAGKSYTVIVKWGATGHAVSFAGGTLAWANGNVIPTATSVAGKRDIYSFVCDDEGTIGRDGGRNA